MVIDTSALQAVLQNEPERRSFNEAIAAAETRLLSVASFVELSIVVLSRHGEDGVHLLDLYLERAGVELVPVDAEQGRVARQAYDRFGRGRHPAGLSYGDCFAYALAMVGGQALLFKGGDFGRTDVAPWRLAEG